MKIVIRELKPVDISEAYCRWMNDPEVNRYLESRFANHSLKTLNEYLISLDKDKNIQFGIFTQEANEHIGNIKIAGIDKTHKRADLGLVVGEKKYWGKGVASAAIALACEFAFRKLGLHKVTASMYANNVGSYKAFEKCGFKKAGVYTKHAWSEDAWVDVILLEKLNGDF